MTSTATAGLTEAVALVAESIASFRGGLAGLAVCRARSGGMPVRRIHVKKRPTIMFTDLKPSCMIFDCLELRFWAPNHRLVRYVRAVHPFSTVASTPLPV